MTADRRPAETADGFLGNRIRLIQPATGHRAGLDAALLQALIPSDAKGHLVDLGTGCGAVAMSAAARAPDLTATGVDIDAAMLDMAKRALALPENSAVAARVQWRLADICGARPDREAAGLADDSADWVTMNPPFDVTSRVRASPEHGRKRAHVGDEETLARWVKAASGLLKTGGRLAMIHRADALGAVLAEMGTRFGAVTLCPVFPREAEPAVRILVTAERGSKAPLAFVRGLVLHRADGRSTTDAQDILAGVTGIECGTSP